MRNIWRFKKRVYICFMKIDKGVKIPKNNIGRANKYPWVDLKIGDSFYIEPAKLKHGIYSCLRSYNKNKAKKPISITLKNEGDGIRVWRIK